MADEQFDTFYAGRRALADAAIPIMTSEEDIEARRREVERIDAYLAEPEAARPFRTIRGGRSEQPEQPAFGLQPVSIIDQCHIPHRQWIYGTQLIRGFVTLLIAPGGTGKSSLLLATCLSIAIGRSLLGPRIFQQCNTAVLNLEDPQDEIDRRLAALAIRYDIKDDDVRGRMFASPPERGIKIAANGADGFSVVNPDEDQIIKQLREQRVGVLGVDPFSESHTLEENSNPAMIQAAAAWRRVARAANCAVVLSHHVRKGPVDSIESARGAKALTDSARIGLLLSTMTEEEAEALGISDTDRLQYVRLDDAKANMAPRAPKAAWFHLGSVTLNNSDATYSHGDQVGVIEIWEPENVWDSVSVSEANSILDKIAAGLDGEPYTDSRRHPATRWAGHVIVRALECTNEQAATIINTWVKNGVLICTEYATDNRKKRKGLRVDDTKRPGTRYE